MYHQYTSAILVVKIFGFAKIQFLLLSYRYVLMEGQTLCLQLFLLCADKIFHKTQNTTKNKFCHFN